jgi:hypothetical protein
MVKYTKQHLLNHEFVRKVSEDGTCATCICGNKIKLKRPFDEDYINQHVEGGGCKRKKNTQEITNFFQINNTQNHLSSIKFFSCTGLCDDKYKAYIECTQLTATNGGAPPHHELAHQLFPLVFPIGLKIKYSN